MNSQIRFTKKDVKSEKAIKSAISRIQRAMIDTGSDPTWKLYSNTFGWFQSQKLLSNDEQMQIESWWTVVYGVEVTPRKEELGEDMWNAFLGASLLKHRT